MDDQALQLKRQQLADIRAHRQELPSILDSFNLTNEPELVCEDSESNEPNKCQACSGKRYYQGLFGRSECFACDGTGFDMSEPIALVKFLQGRIDKSVKIFREQSATIKFLEQFKPDEETLNALAVEDFYNGSKRKD